MHTIWNDINTLERIMIVVEDVIKRVRTQLSLEYDIMKGDNKRYAGLCDISYKLFKDYILEELPHAKVLHFHGEISHISITDSKNWIYQHTWYGIELMGYTIYADATCQQFKHIFKDIPNYYVSIKKPIWFYNDIENPFWNRIIGKTINQNIKIPCRIMTNYLYNVIRKICVQR